MRYGISVTLALLTAVAVLIGTSIQTAPACGAETAAPDQPRAAAGAAPRAPQAPSGQRGVSRNPERNVVIAAVQAGFKLSEKKNPGMEANFKLLADMARQAAASEPRPEMICFPEFAISGWPYPREAEINTLAEPIPGQGPWYRRWYDLAREVKVPLLCWLVESADGTLYNTGFILDAEGQFVGKYRKVHATIGEQAWWGWSQGEQFHLIELDGVRYGISICADMWIPESVRCMELLGADVILHMSIGDDMGEIVPARAIDSRLPIVMSIFRGGSYAVDAKGKLLGKLSSDDPGWKSFTLQPFRPHIGHKYGGRWDMKAGTHNVRNIGAYSILVDPTRRPPWTDVLMDDQGRPQTREQLLKRFNGHYDCHDRGQPPK